MEELRAKAFKLGADGFGHSPRKNKRFFVSYNGTRIHFGAAGGSTFYDHGDEDKRRAWYARHSKIKDKHGVPVIDKPTSGGYWGSRLLW